MQTHLDHNEHNLMNLIDSIIQPSSSFTHNKVSVFSVCEFYHRYGAVIGIRQTPPPLEVFHDN